MKKSLLAFIFWLLACQTLWAAQAIVGTSTANGTGSSLNSCSRAGTTTGNALVWEVTMNLNQTIATFTMAGETVVPLPVAVGEDGDTRLYTGVIQALGSGGTKTLAANFSGAANWSCSIVEVSGQNAAALVDATGQGTGVGNSPTLSANITTTVPSAGVIVFGAAGGSNPAPVSAGYTGFAINTGISGATPGGMYRMDVGAAGAQTVQMSTIGGGAHWTIAAIALRPLGAIPDTTPPTVPGNVQATVISSNQIDLAWSASTDNVAVINYRVERCSGSGCVNFAEISSPATTSYSDPGGAVNTLYRYRVRAFDGTNFSSYSTIVQAATLPVRQATLTWTDTVNTDHTGFTIQRKTGVTGTYVDLTTVGPSLRQYIDTASPQPIACYRVRAIRSGEDGPQSGEACTTTTPTPTPPINLVLGGRIAFGGANTFSIHSRDSIAPSVPTNLVATTAGSSQINVSWNPSTDNIAVINYRVERCEISGCINFAEIATPTGTSLADTGLTSSTFYQYRVRSWDGTNYSGYSSIAFDTTDPLVAPVAAVWVRPNGTLSGCTQSTTAPVGNSGYKPTIDSGIACLNGGDTLMIANGTYPEIVDTATVRAIPAGSSGSPTTIKAQNRGGAILTGVTPGAGAEAMFFLRDGSHFITVDGIVVDGSNGSTKSGFAGSGASDAPHDVELTYVTARNFQQQGIIFSHGTTGGRLRVNHSRSHNNGTNCLGFALGAGHCHGMYLNGYPNSTIEDSEFDNNEAFGIHAYSEPPQNDNVTIQRNKIHHNGIGGAQGVSPDTAGIIAGSGVGIRVENNLLYNNTSGVWCEFNATVCLVSNNTIFGNTGAQAPYSAIYAGANSVSGVIATNNIVFQNARAIVDNSGSLVNITNLLTNPLFVNSAAFDFRLSVGSAAIGTGSNTSSQYTTDFAGTTRTVPYDIGALAYSAGIAPTCPATVGNGLVAAYSFNGVATDLSANANTASIGAGNAYVTGKYGQGIGFDGTTAVLLNHINAYWLCNGYTLSAWVSVPALTDFRAVISSDYAGQDGYFLYAGSQNYGQDGAPIGGYCTSVLVCGVASTMTNLTANTMTYMAVTYDPTLASANTKLYIGGVLVASANGQAQLANWSGLIAIGGSPYFEVLPSGSVIDEVRIYSRPLTAGQIVTDRDTPL